MTAVSKKFHAKKIEGKKSMAKHDQILHYIANKNWSSLTGLAGDCERKFQSRFSVLDFNGWCLVAKVDKQTVAMLMDSGAAKGEQVSMYVYNGTKKLVDPIGVLQSELST